MFSGEIKYLSSEKVDVPTFQIKLQKFTFPSCKYLYKYGRSYSPLDKRGYFMKNVTILAKTWFNPDDVCWRGDHGVHISGQSLLVADVDHVPSVSGPHDMYTGQWSQVHSTNNDKLILLIHILTAFLLSSLSKYAWSERCRFIIFTWQTRPDREILFSPSGQFVWLNISWLQVW